MQSKFQAGVTSEIGSLETVIIHTPGPEVENMTPQNAERALYSDILSLSVVSEEYSQFRSILRRFSKTLEIRDLLGEVLSDCNARDDLVNRICENEEVGTLSDHLRELPAAELTRQLLEGVPLIKDNLTRFLSDERYSLQPLHNFFFTRDAAITFHGEVIISALASKVREREAIIMQCIFNHHPELRTGTIPVRPAGNRDRRITFEGGDLLVAREDVLLIGNGARTSTRGVDFLLEELKRSMRTTHVLIQELPTHPESFIHLDMVFTFLDVDTCLVYPPVILNRHDFQTVHIVVDGGKVTSIYEELDLPHALRNLGIDVRPIYCGGKNDSWTQEREQWHSGANFLALAPGKVMGYGRNRLTLDALNQDGFEILSAKEIIAGSVDPEQFSRLAVTIDGSELARGGGGCRCMTMPFRRGAVDW
jgi:arginine deiminase